MLGLGLWVNDSMGLRLKAEPQSAPAHPCNKCWFCKREHVGSGSRLCLRPQPCTVTAQVILASAPPAQVLLSASPRAHPSHLAKQALLMQVLGWSLWRAYLPVASRAPKVGSRWMGSGWIGSNAIPPRQEGSAPPPPPSSSSTTPMLHRPSQHHPSPSCAGLVSTLPPAHNRSAKLPLLSSSPNN